MKKKIEQRDEKKKARSSGRDMCASLYHQRSGNMLKHVIRSATYMQNNLVRRHPLVPAWKDEDTHPSFVIHHFDERNNAFVLERTVDKMV